MPLKKNYAKPFYPRFEAIFGVTINPNSTIELKVDENKFNEFYRYTDAHMRVASMVDLYVDSLIEYKIDDDRPPVSLCFVLIHDQVYQHGRIKSKGLGDPIKVGIKNKHERSILACSTKLTRNMQKGKPLTIIIFIATFIYYKSGGLRWKFGSIRKDVCYIALVIKSMTVKKTANLLVEQQRCF